MLSRSARNSFELLSPEVILAIGMVAQSTGHRPSEIMEWNDEWDWEARLMFDMAIMGPMLEKMNRGVR